MINGVGTEISNASSQLVLNHIYQVLNIKNSINIEPPISVLFRELILSGTGYKPPTILQLLILINFKGYMWRTFIFLVGYFEVYKT